MKQGITYSKEGIFIGDTFLPLYAIRRNCTEKKIEQEDLVLLKISYETRHSRLFWEDKVLPLKV